MDILVGTSLVAAFIAGLAALFAPCCITVLLPSYLGSIFRERKKVFIMTFIFFLGVLVVFLPLGLGSAAFGQLLSRYHSAIFIIGSIFLLMLGLMLLLGRHFSLPFHVNPTLKNHHPFSVFTLGIFSGIATTCCAPVLAGVLALSALPGSVFWGMMYTLSYVLGMVAPLFFIALFLDKSAITKKLMQVRKPISYSLGSVKVSLTIGEFISGVMFVIMAILTMSLAFFNKLNVHSSYQVNINIYLTKLFNALRGLITFFPEYVWAIIFLFLLIGLIIKTIYLFKKETYEQDDKS
ncbi:MAG: cytochrome c biogenesis protein CcdA, partial [Candidatus Komeilibacteria bacterium]|nr:cytochrome c biogenesis protein CcdA [Candidatus Komeilibacteria bacterium]